jgi:methylated-DNA-[protein]-cysteine S-methyltransferase
MNVPPSPLVAAFTTFPAPWGALHVATTAAGIVAVGLDGETPGFVDGLSRRLHGPVLPAEDGAVPEEWRAALGEAMRQIGEYLAGERQGFEVPIDLRVSAWDRLVLTGAARLHFGETASYGELAVRIGRPGAARAVGGAMGRNPVPILIPCHRIVGANRTIGGYGGYGYADRQAALTIKRHLLAIEGTTGLASRSLAGRSLAGRSLASRSLAGRSLA